MMEHVKWYLHTGTSKSTFVIETDSFLSELENGQRERFILNFQDLFSTYFPKQ